MGIGFDFGLAFEGLSALCALGCLAFGLWHYFSDRSAKQDARIAHIENYLENSQGYRPLTR